MDTTKIKETQMTKTPEELTADWKAGDIATGTWCWVRIDDEQPKPMVVDCDGCFQSFDEWYAPDKVFLDLEILAICDYNEYKAMQEELAEHRHYCCCMENEVMRLDMAKLEEEIKSLRQKKEEWAYECGKADELNRQLRTLLKEGTRLLSFEHEVYEVENFIKEVDEVIND